MLNRMRTLREWLTDYSNDHQNPQNRRLHLICVPAIFTTIAGSIHLLPHHLGDLALFFIAIWYAVLGFLPLVLILTQLVLALALTELLTVLFGTPVALAIFGIVFADAWIGQFYGHHLEGRRPSFFKDLQYLLIGPLWVWLGHRRPRP